MSGDPSVELRGIGRCLDDLKKDEDWEAKISGDYERICLIVVNTNANFRMNLGMGALNDAVVLARAMKLYNFEIFYVLKPTVSIFRTVTSRCLRSTTEHMVFFYTGHGNLKMTVTSKSVSRPFVFGEESISDEQFMESIRLNRQEGARLTLITDSCQPDSIWDLRTGTVHGKPAPENMVSISSTVDMEMIEDVDVGPSQKSEFVTHLAKWMEQSPSLTPKDLYMTMRKVMKRWGQDFIVGSTTEGLMDVPLF